MYTWNLDESIANGVERLMKEQVDFILSNLNDADNNRDDAVHESRKSFKKIRALLRLIRHEIGETTYHQQNTFYRDLSRQLAPLRDNFVVARTLRQLIDGLDDDTCQSTARIIHNDLHEEYLEIRESFWLSGQAVASVVKSLENTRETAGQYGIKRNSFEVFEKGLRRVYRRGRNRMDIAYAMIPATEGFHDWRKRVKYLWYQLCILKPINPARLNPLLTQLEQLSECLGDAHDYAVLYDRIENHPQTQNGAGRHLLAHIDLKRGEQETLARSHGTAIYEVKTGKFVRQIQSWWENPEPVSASPF